MLSKKVKSVRNLMNPYQLGDSSHHHKTPPPAKMDTSLIDIGTDIDETEVDVDDESSFADDAGDVAYLLGETPEEDEAAKISEEEDRKISSPGSPASVIDRTSAIFPNTDASVVSNTSSSKSSRTSERRKSISSGSVSRKKNATGDNSPTGSPTRRSRRRSTQVLTSDHGPLLEEGDRKKATRTSAGSSKNKEEEEDQKRDHSRRLARRSSTRRMGSDTDDTADSYSAKCEIPAKKRQSARQQQRRCSTGAISRTDSEDEEHPREERRKKDLLGRSEHKKIKLPLRKQTKQQRRGSTGTLSDDGDVAESLEKQQVSEGKRSDGKNGNQESSRKSLSRGSSHRRMIGKGSNHSEKRKKSRRGSRSSSTTTSSDKSENDAISITNRTESRKVAVSKKRSKFVNQKSCKVGPIIRRARARRPSVQDLPPVEPIIGYGHSCNSGSFSSLTISTGIGSMDDFSLPSPGVFSTNKDVLPSTPLAASSHERRTAALSRWQALPKGSSPNTSPDGIPTLPDHDLSSMCSPGALSSNPGIISRKHVGAVPRLPLPSHSAHCTSHTTPSSISKNSSSFSNSFLSGSMQSLGLEDKRFHGGSKNKYYPEIRVPATPTRSMGGVVSELSTPGAMSALTTPGTNDGSKTNSLHAKLKQLAGNPSSLAIRISETDTPGGYLSELTTTPCTRRNMGTGLRSKLMEAVPVTPSLSIGVGELDTPGGIVSELTVGSSLLSGSSSLWSYDRNGKVSNWMTNVQSVMLHESEYHCRDGIPKMARRHSLDSVSYVEEGCEPRTPSSEKEESDFAPKAPARQNSLSSILM